MRAHSDRRATLQTRRSTQRPMITNVLLSATTLSGVSWHICILLFVLNIPQEDPKTSSWSQPRFRTIRLDALRSGCLLIQANRYPFLRYSPTFLHWWIILFFLHWPQFINLLLWNSLQSRYRNSCIDSKPVSLFQRLHSIRTCIDGRNWLIQVKIAALNNLLAPI